MALRERMRAAARARGFAEEAEMGRIMADVIREAVAEETERWQTKACLAVRERANLTTLRLLSDRAGVVPTMTEREIRHEIAVAVQEIGDWRRAFEAEPNNWKPR